MAVSRWEKSKSDRIREPLGASADRLWKSITIALWKSITIALRASADRYMIIVHFILIAIIIPKAYLKEVHYAYTVGIPRGRFLPLGLGI